MKDGKVKQMTAYRTIGSKVDVGYVKASDRSKIKASKATTGLKIEITDKNGGSDDRD